MDDAERYSRQERLAQVGSLGQKRLQAATFVVNPGPCADTEELYLRRAGATLVNVEHVDTTPKRFPHAGVFRYAAPRNLAEGAWGALTQIQRVLRETV